MRFTHNSIDLAQFDASRQPPGDIITRNKPEHWLVPFTPISLDSNPDWREYVKGGDVYIPLVPYLMSSEPSLALGFMLQLGLYATAGVGQEIERLHISTGFPVYEIEDPETKEKMWKYHVGFGLVFK